MSDTDIPRIDPALLAHLRQQPGLLSEHADAYLNTGRIDRDTFDVLWRSNNIYYDPYVFSGRLCPEYKARIRKALLEDQEELAGFLASQDASGFAPVSHAEYAPLLVMMPGQSED